MGGKSYKTIIAGLVLLSSCVKDKPQPASNTAGASGSTYIVCEGNFGNGNGTLYSYDRLKDTAYGDIYKQVNNQSLGDVFQSMVRIGDRFFLCINNSDKIVVLNAADKKQVGTISIHKPRYILPISDTKAYVSALYDDKVYIINPQTLQVTGEIPLPARNPEGMCLYNNEAIVCTWDTLSNSIYTIDIASDKVIKTIKVGGSAPQSALLDKQQMLWVLSGNKEKKRTAAITRVDPSTGAILTTFQFSADVDALKPVFNKTKDTLYFIEVDYKGKTANNGIYRMPIDATILPAEPLIAAKQYQYFWALGIEPATGHLLVGDPKGFIQKGSVLVYRQDGTLRKTLAVGLGPGFFYFDQ
jgi:YVTN family beta-propeller protein